MPLDSQAIMGSDVPAGLLGSSVAAVLLVSADPTLDEAYRQALSGHGHTAACVSGTAEAVRALLTLKVQAIVLDSRLCGGGDDFRRWLGADPERARLPVLYLIPPAGTAQAVLLRPGVDGVLRRPFAPGDLAEAVAAVLGGSRREDLVERVRAGAFALDLRRRVLSLGERSIALTAIEGRLLRYLMERPGTPVSFEELLTRVWGHYPGTGGPEVVRAHVRNVRRKLRRVAPDRDVLLTVPRLGYRFLGGEADHSLE